MVRDPNHQVFDSTEPSWSDSDMFAHLVSLSWELDVSWTEVDGTLTTVFSASASGSSIEKRHIKDDQTSADNWFAGYGPNRTMMPPLYPIALIYGIFEPLGTIGTITVTEEGEDPVVTNVTDGDGWGITCARLTDESVDADFPAQIGLRENRVGVFAATPAGSTNFSLGQIHGPFHGDLKAVINGGTATIEATKSISETGYSFSGTYSLTITTA